MANSEITVGSIVMLKSGGPRMTVLTLTGTEANCVWFSSLHDKPHSATFPINILVELEINSFEM